MKVNSIQYMLVLLVSVNCLEKLLKITLNSHNS